MSEKGKIAKIAVAEKMDDALSEALAAINRGFDGGRVTKFDLANWIIAKSCANLTESVIEEIRRDHFNEVSYLKNTLRNLQSANRSSLTAEEVEAINRVLRRKAVAPKANKKEIPVGEYAKHAENS